MSFNTTSRSRLGVPASPVAPPKLGRTRFAVLRGCAATQRPPHRSRAKRVEASLASIISGTAIKLLGDSNVIETQRSKAFAQWANAFPI